VLRRSSTTTARTFQAVRRARRTPDGDRWIEIWNLVFMQFDRSAEGVLTPLPKPSVDTGMGLERTAAVMQGVHSNYEIDLFVNLIKAAAEATNTRDLEAKSLRVIADHIRARRFLIADGVFLQRRARLRAAPDRASRAASRLHPRPEPAVLLQLVAALEKEMGAAYPELKTQRAQIERVLKAGRRALCGDAVAGHGAARHGHRLAQGQQGDSGREPCSACTTPSAFRRPHCRHRRASAA
jgi:alanyl-tRNA synthetase